SGHDRRGSAPCAHPALGGRHEEEAADLHPQELALRTLEDIGPLHRAPARGELAAALVLEVLARPELGELAHHSRPTDVLAAVVGIEDDPMPRGQLDPLLALVLDADPVLEEELASLGVRLRRDVARLGDDADVARDGVGSGWSAHDETLRSNARMSGYDQP